MLSDGKICINCNKKIMSKEMEFPQYGDKNVNANVNANVNIIACTSECYINYMFGN